MTTTNRVKLAQASALIEDVMTDEAISPTPYAHLHEAVTSICAAAKFVLDMNERDGVTKVQL